ncbi:MAG: hypothetical protein JW876_03445 [Candidatus Krumholzibacteriota bacterium]|nr:hypothetical protein [Candidatus Krumholzibacteriota bacterium]
MSSGKTCAIAILMAVALPAANARARPAPADSALYEVSAGKVRLTQEEGERVVLLEGGVQIDHQTTTITGGRGKHFPERRYIVLVDGVEGVDGSMRMWGQRGEYFGDENVLAVHGDVRMKDRGWDITADRARYDRRLRIVILVGNVVIADSSRTMYADSVRYDRDAGLADATGRVVLVDPVENYSISGRHARFDRNDDSAVVDDRPVLAFDLDSTDQGNVTSEWMRFLVDENVGVAVGNVMLKKGETRASCDSAAVRDDEGVIELHGSPSATSGSSGMRGEWMVLHYDSVDVHRIVIPSKGRLTERPGEDSPWREDSWIEGDSIVIHLTDEAVDSVQIVGGARAMYYPYEGEAGKVSNNFAEGDTMYFRFRGDDLSYVRISGNAKGVYNFLTLGPGETIDSTAAAIDSALAWRNFRLAADKVRYSGRLIEYFADTEDMKLDGRAVVDYGNKSLEAAHIDFNSRLNVLEATGEPVLTEDDQKMYGDRMGYDMEGEGGVVVDGSTRYEEGFYRGEHIFKEGQDVLKVYRSVYTTCDHEHPHYSLRAAKMKVYLRDKIVSGPIYLYIGEMPVFYLPYMANSLRHDRHSGLLRPNFDIGINSRDGRFIRGLGYYWATNDYTDFTVTTDFNEYQNFRVQVDNRYKIRYLLDGNVRFNYLRDLDDYSNQWTLSSTHNQTFGKTASFNSSLRFVSSDGAQQSLHQADDVERFVDRRIYSSATFRKNWGETRLSLSGSRDQTLNVTTPTQTSLNMTLPSLSLTLPRTSLWFGEKHPEGQRGLWERFLGGFTFSPNLKATRQVTESDAREKSTLTASSGVSFGRQLKLSFLNLSPSVSTSWSYFETLYDRVDTAYVDPASVVSSADRNEFSMRFATGVGTSLYGTFYPKIGPLVGIRHTFNPTATYSFTPKLTENQRESQGVSYSVRNVVEMKILRGGQERKQKLFNWDVNGSYNPKATERPFSDVSSSFSSGLGRLATFRMSNTYDPYEGKISSTTISLGSSLSLGGSFTYPGGWKKRDVEKIAAARDAAPDAPDSAAADRDIDELRDLDLSGPVTPGKPGSWSMNLNYSLSRSGMGDYQRVTSQFDVTGKVQLTENWAVRYSAYYDVEERNFTSQMYTIDRDLHCWRASFIHRRFGDDWSYYFQIAIKAHPDIMYERGNRGLQGGFSF